MFRLVSIALLFSGVLAAPPLRKPEAPVQAHIQSGSHTEGIPQTGWKNGGKPEMPVDVGDRVTVMGRMIPTHLDGQTITNDWGNEYGPQKKPAVFKSGVPTLGLFGLVAMLF
eukprot:gnl/MRDRNA2_/MRDRNA2_29982_c0_seq1.p1 gnl/MRDRNA2_/MRDRNA2_29982_c0~~gnl/MRDRNA2_/MRDRNA2_29982_c0_seq1.p1  ORF type:complete len:112 (+),score=22.78 gnl/MRDRNA2_/MRDRNA2_29982_c0_seq1:87-422(+)